MAGGVVHLDYNISSLALVCQKSNVNPKRALKSYGVGGWWVVHLDYNVSSLALVCQKSNVNPKRALKSYRWVGGWCTWIITSAFWPLFVQSQMSKLREL